MKIFFLALGSCFLVSWQEPQYVTDYKNGVGYYNRKEYYNAIQVLMKSYKLRNSDLVAYYIAASYSGLQKCDSVVKYAKLSVLLNKDPAAVSLKESIKMINSCNLTNINSNPPTVIVVQRGASGGGTFKPIDDKEKLLKDKQRIKNIKSSRQ
jgi:hypothetical protein